MSENQFRSDVIIIFAGAKVSQTFLSGEGPRKIWNRWFSFKKGKSWPYLEIFLDEHSSRLE